MPFLVPPRSSVIELMVVLVLTPVYCCTMAIVINPSFLAMILDDSFHTSAKIVTLTCVVFQSYPLISQPFAENTPYQSSDAFSLVSYHY
jgi:hypothetical protein